MSISVQYNRKKQASPAPEGDDNMISSDWLALDYVTDWNDTKTGLTPAGKLPFHLNIEVLGLDREQRRRWRERMRNDKATDIDKEGDKERELGT